VLIWSLTVALKMQVHLPVQLNANGVKALTQSFHGPRTPSSSPTLGQHHQRLGLRELALFPY